MSDTKYIIETNVHNGDRFQEYFDTLEAARDAFEDAIIHTTDRELKNRDIVLGYMERTDSYIPEEYLNDDEWFRYYHGYDPIRSTEDERR